MSDDRAMIRDILDFWFEGHDRKDWFMATAAFDASLRRRFAAATERALAGAFDHWAEDADGALALLLLLDQFPRNLFRGDAKAFAGDRAAMAVAEKALARGFDQIDDIDRRAFFYMPFEHAEDLAAQERAVALFAPLGVEDFDRAAIAHRDIIARFGRFPHRNATLGRESTAEERAYLEDGAQRFGQ